MTWVGIVQNHQKPIDVMIAIMLTFDVEVGNHQRNVRVSWNGDFPSAVGFGRIRSREIRTRECAGSRVLEILAAALESLVGCGKKGYTFIDFTIESRLLWRTEISSFLVR